MGTLDILYQYEFEAFSESGVHWIKNYINVFIQPVLKDATFLPLFLRTVLWTFVNVFFHVLGGLVLALLLNRKMRGRAIYRTLLVLPWAIPQIIAVLAWRNEFHYEFGFINIIIRALGFQPVSWLTQPDSEFYSHVYHQHLAWYSIYDDHSAWWSAKYQ